jgi:galactonate dehydratase
MRIESLETLRHEAHPNLLHVIVRAEDGTEGLGETFYEPENVEAHLQAQLAPNVVGAEVADVRLGPSPDDPFRSTAWSARSALDLALHDLRARLEAVPLCELLGGAVRDAVPVYVTCIDPLHPGEDWGLGVPGGSGHRDWTAALERPGELAAELVERGFGGAKLFPFVRLEQETGGRWITDELLEPQLEPFRAMRDAAGPDFDLLCDLAGGWALAPAVEIARALEPVGLAWLEDPLPAAQLDDLRTLADRTSIPLAGHETRAGVESFRELLAAGAISVAHLDVQWCGGVAEAARIAELAGAHGLPVAFHDCAGPVGWACSLHAALALPNAGLLECARPYALDAYPQMADGVPRLEAGRAVPAPGSGHGVSLSEDYLAGATARTCR